MTFVHSCASHLFECAQCHGHGVIVRQPIAHTIAGQQQQAVARQQRLVRHVRLATQQRRRLLEGKIAKGPAAGTECELVCEGECDLECEVEKEVECEEGMPRDLQRRGLLEGKVAQRPGARSVNLSVKVNVRLSAKLKGEVEGDVSVAQGPSTAARAA